MTKAYTILHIPTGNYCWIELYEDIQTISENNILTKDIKSDYNLSGMNFYLSKSFLPTKNSERNKVCLLLSYEESSLKYILNSVRFRKHLCMDIFNKSDYNKYIDHLAENEFEIVEYKNV